MTTSDSNLSPMTATQWAKACHDAIEQAPPGTWAHLLADEREPRLKRAAELVRLHWLGYAQPTRGAIGALQALFAYVTTYAQRDHARRVHAASGIPGERFALDADE